MTIQPFHTSEGLRLSAPSAPVPSVAPTVARSHPALQFGNGGDRFCPLSRERLLMQALVQDLNTLPEGDTILMGRDPRMCDYVLESSHVSRIHAAFLKRNGQYYVKDVGTPTLQCQEPGTTNGTWHIDGRDLIPYPVDIRGPIQRTLDGKPLKDVRVDGLKLSFSPLYQGEKTQRIQNGDTLFVYGHILPVEGLEPGDTTPHDPVILTPEAAQRDLIALVRRLDELAKITTAVEDVSPAELMQVRLLLHREMRFEMFCKLRKLGFSEMQAEGMVNVVRRSAKTVMNRFEGRLDDLRPDLHQSVMSLRRLPDPEGPDDFSRRGG